LGTLNIQGGTVTGQGTISAPVVNAGEFNPGSTPGVLGVVGIYSQTSDGGLNIEIGGNSAGTQFDQLNVEGTISLSGSLELSLINGFVPALNSTFTIINNDGSEPLVGTFSGLPEGAIITVGAIQFSISYLGADGTGNDVILKAIVVPMSAKLLPDPCDPAMTALGVFGTSGHDSIVISVGSRFNAGRQGSSFSRWFPVSAL
jgi:hypothetical protein